MFERMSQTFEKNLDNYLPPNYLQRQAGLEGLHIARYE